MSYQNLSQAKIKATVRLWDLIQDPLNLKPTPGAKGRLLRDHMRRPLGIVIAVDAETQRVQVQSGNVYQLSTPMFTFTQRQPTLARELGFLHQFAMAA